MASGKEAFAKVVKSSGVSENAVAAVARAVGKLSKAELEALHDHGKDLKADPEFQSIGTIVGAPATPIGEGAPATPMTGPIGPSGPTSTPPAQSGTPADQETGGTGGTIGSPKSKAASKKDEE